MTGSEKVCEFLAKAKTFFVLTTDGDTFSADGIFILRQQIAPSQLVPGLTMDGNHVAVDSI